MQTESIQKRLCLGNWSHTTDSKNVRLQLCSSVSCLHLWPNFNRVSLTGWYQVFLEGMYCLSDVGRNRQISIATDESVLGRSVQLFSYHLKRGPVQYSLSTKASFLMTSELTASLFLTKSNHASRVHTHQRTVCSWSGEPPLWHRRDGKDL